MKRADCGQLHRWLALVMLGLLALDCATTQSRLGTGSVAPPQPQIPSTEAVRRIFAGPPTTTASVNAETGHSDPITTLTLEQVLSIAKSQNPTFAEFEANRAAARAELVQATAYPNPEIEAGAGVAKPREGSGKWTWELGVGLFQPIEMPAKRRARRAAAEASLPIVEREEDVFRSTLRAELTEAYHTVLYYQHTVDLAKETLRIEQEIEQIVHRRVEGGESPAIDRVKAQVERLKASRAMQLQQRQLAAARAVLNALCGHALPAHFALEDLLESPLAAVDVVEARRIALAQHPALRRLEALRRQKEMIVQREQKAWYPDLKPGLGLGREIDAYNIGAALGLVIPFWYRNQGGIAAAKADLQKIEAEIKRVRVEIERDLETAAQAYESAREQLAAFRTGLRAAAIEALRIETSLYQEGEVEFLQLLDARRTARQTETEYLQALYDAQIARAELERAIGIGGKL